MFKKILIPMDFGDHCEEVLQCASILADKFESEIHLLHVIEDLAALASGPDGFFRMPSDTEQELIKHAGKQLEEYKIPNGLKVACKVTHVTDGIPFVQIIKYARENEIDLIVMGTHGRTALSHMLMGSVAEKVIRKSPCPTLTVRPEKFKFEMP